MPSTRTNFDTDLTVHSRHNGAYTFQQRIDFSSTPLGDKLYRQHVRFAKVRGKRIANGAEALL